jgi:hypothetical protein
VAILLLAPVLWAKDKHPERKIRDQYAEKFAREVESDGYYVIARATEKNPPIDGSLSFRHGDHDNLRISFIRLFDPDNEPEQFTIKELAPRLHLLLEMGFTQIQLTELPPTKYHPLGIWTISTEDAIRAMEGK